MKQHVFEFAGQETESELARQEKLAVLLEQSSSMDDFCKYAKSNCSMTRTAARAYYRKHKLNKNVPKIKPVEQEMPRTPARGYSRKHKLNKNAAEIKTLEQAREAVIASSPLLKLEQEARDMARAQGAMDALLYLKAQTEMDILPLKFWLDCILDPTRPEPALLKNAKQEYLIRLQRMQPAARLHISMQAQVTQQRMVDVDKSMDAVKSQQAKLNGITLAGDNKQMLVQVARRIARQLGEKGPVTIEDVTVEMAKSHNVMAAKGGKRHNWKGAVFATSEWVYIGDTPAKQISSHGRQVGVWALKTWLQDNTLNGKDARVSAFVLSKIQADFRRSHGSRFNNECLWIIGNKKIAREIVDTITRTDNTLYGIPVQWVDGVGAILTILK